MITIDQLAVEAGMSPKTVKKALAGVRPTMAGGSRVYVREVALEAVADYILAGRRPRRIKHTTESDLEAEEIMGGR
jgi:hypothetical protein